MKQIKLIKVGRLTKDPELKKQIQDLVMCNLI